MSDDDKRRSIVLRRVACGTLSLSQASKVLRLSYRQTKRVWQRWREEGDDGLAHRNRGRPSNRSFPEEFKNKILQQYEEQCERIGPTQFAKRLSEDGIDIDHETLRRWLLKNGTWTLSPCSRNEGQRKRSNLGFGQLLTLIAIHDVWTGPDGPSSTLFCLHDEATSASLFSLASGDSAGAAMRILWQWIEQYGIPAAIRCERQFVCVKNWRPTLEEQLSGAEPITPLCSACERLGIDTRMLTQSESKSFLHGEERLFEAVKAELSSVGSMPIHVANQRLRETINRKMNGRFSDRSVSKDYHVRIIDGTDLRTIFCFNKEHSVSWNRTFEHDNRVYRLEADFDRSPALVRKVTVSRWLDGSLHVLSGTNELQYVEVSADSSSSDRSAM